MKRKRMRLQTGTAPVYKAARPAVPKNSVRPPGMQVLFGRRHAGKAR